MRNIYYSKLRELMAKHLMDKQDIAKIIGKSYRQTSKILHGEFSTHSQKPYIFDINEACKITKVFKDKGENITVEDLFYDEVLSIASSE